MKKTKIFLGLAIIVTIIAGVVLLKYGVNPNVKRWYGYKVDVTNIHDVYTETKETQALVALETSLQDKKIPYTISGKKLETEFFDYDVSNIEAVSIINDQDIAKKFDIIDQRDFSKAKVEVDYKNGKKVETVSYNDIYRINNTYYCFKKVVIAVYALMLIFIIIFAIPLFKRDEEKNKKVKSIYHTPTYTPPSTNTTSNSDE